MGLVDFLTKERGWTGLGKKFGDVKGKFLDDGFKNKAVELDNAMTTRLKDLNGMAGAANSQSSVLNVLMSNAKHLALVNQGKTRTLNEGKILLAPWKAVGSTMVNSITGSWEQLKQLAVYRMDSRYGENKREIARIRAELKAKLAEIEAAYAEAKTALDTSRKDAVSTISNANRDRKKAQSLVDSLSKSTKKASARELAIVLASIGVADKAARDALAAILERLTDAQAALDQVRIDIEDLKRQVAEEKDDERYYAQAKTDAEREKLRKKRAQNMLAYIEERRRAGVIANAQHFWDVLTTIDWAVAAPAVDSFGDLAGDPYLDEFRTAMLQEVVFLRDYLNKFAAEQQLAQQLNLQSAQDAAAIGQALSTAASALSGIKTGSILV
ncbi:MAG: hypothetical protein QF486_04875 [Candidatus Woesearchaeota archaeon]|jgi:hypothetical protein|nr:hypothetical protein [Candidatus Woesearchaeota archaeon]MDP7198925.1 hypothetical protein [Candidatus Woesearchaeota archaeon]MDP7467304.1 hypothetical protein [Candidatus Woesearchaeota archaeon]MDP7647920.1 hypothetical protein [Candidatus Woesearchaeota archaeon]